MNPTELRKAARDQQPQSGLFKVLPPWAKESNRAKSKRLEDANLLQTPGIEPGTFCAANGACVATDC